MSWTKKSSWCAVLVAVAAGIALAISPLLAHAAKGLQCDWGFNIKAFKVAGLQSPRYVQVQGRDLLVSDARANGGGGIFRVTMRGRATPITARGALHDPGGLAVAPAGFGSYAGQIFVLVPDSAAKGACRVDRVDRSGTVSLFATLPNAGKLNGGVPADCRDLEFGSSGPFLGRLYAIADANASIYEIDASGKARVFGTYDNPRWDLEAMVFSAANDRKAPNSMLIATRPFGLGPSAKIGRINIIDAKGVMAASPYLAGFIRPTGFAHAPAGFGSYGGVLFIVDGGAPAATNGAAHDGEIYRVYQGVAREFASGMVDPNCLRFVGAKTMLLADPSESGTVGRGSLITVKSML